MEYSSAPGRVLVDIMFTIEQVHRVEEVVRGAERALAAGRPVLMLDEVDKLGRDFRGDPAAALLEILDPEQNKTFRDNYLDLPFDLSKVLFITTANTLDTIPAPLLDRMEILRLSGYSEEEKTQIAKRYLLPKLLQHTGLTAEQCVITEQALQKVIESYTREAGVRRLEQMLGRLIRKVAVKFAEGEAGPVVVHGDDVPEMLGPEAILPELARKELPAGTCFISRPRCFRMAKSSPSPVNWVR